MVLVLQIIKWFNYFTKPLPQNFLPLQQTWLLQMTKELTFIYVAAQHLFCGWIKFHWWMLQVIAKPSTHHCSLTFAWNHSLIHTKAQFKLNPLHCYKYTAQICCLFLMCICMRMHKKQWHKNFHKMHTCITRHVFHCHVNYKICTNSHTAICCSIYTHASSLVLVHLDVYIRILNWAESTM